MKPKSNLPSHIILSSSNGYSSPISFSEEHQAYITTQYQFPARLDKTSFQQCTITIPGSSAAVLVEDDKLELRPTEEVGTYSLQLSATAGRDKPSKKQIEENYLPQFSAFELNIEAQFETKDQLPLQIQVWPENLSREDIELMSSQAGEIFKSANSPVYAAWITDAREGIAQHDSLRLAWKQIIARPLNTTSRRHSRFVAGKMFPRPRNLLAARVGRPSLATLPTSANHWNSLENGRLLYLLHTYLDQLKKNKSTFENLLQDLEPGDQDHEELKNYFEESAARSREKLPELWKHADEKWKRDYARDYFTAKDNSNRGSERWQIGFDEIEAVMDEVSQWISFLSRKGVVEQYSSTIQGLKYWDHKGYSRFEKEILKIERQQSINTSPLTPENFQKIFKAGIRPTQEIFEIWCFIKLFHGIQTHCGLTPRGLLKDMFEYNQGVWKLRKTNHKNHSISMRFESSTGNTTIDLFPEPTLHLDESRNYFNVGGKRITRTNCAPDMLLRLSQETPRGKKTRWIIIDAKYFDLSSLDNPDKSRSKSYHDKLRELFHTLYKYGEDSECRLTLDRGKSGETRIDDVDGIYILFSKSTENSSCPEAEDHCTRWEKPNDWALPGGLPFEDFAHLIQQGSRMEDARKKACHQESLQDSDSPNHSMGIFPCDLEEGDFQLQRLLWMTQIWSDDDEVYSCPSCASGIEKLIILEKVKPDYFNEGGIEHFNNYRRKSRTEGWGYWHYHCENCFLSWIRNHCRSADGKHSIFKFTGELSHLNFHHPTEHGDWHNPGHYRCPNCNDDYSKHDFDTHYG